LAPPLQVRSVPQARRASNAPLQRQAAAAPVENQHSLDEYSIYNTQAVAAGLAFWFTAAISVFAAGPEEAGFCPVISKRR
jgi:hypothetical protein